MRRIRAFALCLLLSLQPLPIEAEAAGRRDFTDSLSRAVPVAGLQDQRFRLRERMAHYLVPGVSVAIIDHCRIVDARGFGRSAGQGQRITPRTLFQAGSISKTFTAVAALRLVEQGTLSLDGDVRRRLTSWTLPDSPLLQGRNVTLRALLSHTAGINQEGGVGYLPGAPLPTLSEILEGRSPANTSPIRVESAPGAWHYSGGGYYIIQALMRDATSQDYPQLMDRLIFSPLRLNHSTFSQPLERRRMMFAARAVGPDGSPLEGGWRVNPELAAGGLWTTPTDIAKLLIGVTRAVRGEDRSLLGPHMAGELMKRGPGDWGLGVDLGPAGPTRRFRHTGHNIGFVSEYVIYPDTCQGAVVMTNADQGGWLAAEILRAIGDSYGWPDRMAAASQTAITLTPSIERRFVGTYRLRDFPTERFIISRRANGLYWARVGHVGRDLLPESDGRLFSPDSQMVLEVDDPEVETAQILSLSFGGGRNVALRVD